MKGEEDGRMVSEEFAYMGSMDGIHGIELVPSTGERGVLDRLRHVLARTECLRAAVAYWCVAPLNVSGVLIRALSGPGFLCADLHLPTDIDILAGMTREGANVHLHLLHPNPQPGELKSQMPQHLMHTKVLLFDLMDGAAELWVGSHNWTNRALSGLNVEASLVVRMTRQSEAYASALRLLEEIRSFCEPFDLEKVSRYKWWQGQGQEGDPMWILELKADDPPALTDARVTAFGVSEDDFRNLKTVDKDLIVLVENVRTGEELRYRARVADTGRTTAAGIGFEPRLHAFAAATGRPLLVGPSVPDEPRVRSSVYWASVKLQGYLDEACTLEEMAPTDRWIVSPNDPFERRMDERARNLYAAPSRPLISRPNIGDLSSISGRQEARMPAPAERPRLFRRVLVRGLPKSR